MCEVVWIFFAEGVRDAVLRFAQDLLVSCKKLGQPAVFMSVDVTKVAPRSLRP